MVRGPTLQRGLWAAPYGLTFPSSPTLTVEEECEKIKSEAERERVEGRECVCVRGREREWKTGSVCVRERETL